MNSTTTPQERLSARIDSNLAILAGGTADSETGTAMAGALTDVKAWMAEPGATWEGLTRKVSNELGLAIGAHRASGQTGTEDIPAYARADALRAVQSWMTEIAG